MAIPSPRAHDEARQFPSPVLDHPTGFAKVMNDVARSKKLSLQELGVYTLIVGYSGPTGECWQTQEQLAEFAGVTVRSLQRHIKQLVKLGFLDERTRHESVERSKGKSLRVSHRWRQEPAESRDTGVTRLYPDSVSHTTPVSDSHDTGVASHATPVSHLKRPVQKTLKTDSVPESSPGVASATAPPATTPSKSSTSKPRAKRATVEETPAPETLELTPALYAHGASLGYDEARVRLELQACLDFFGSNGRMKADWVRTFRNWLTGEWKRDQQRAVGGYRGGNGRSASNGERQWTGKPGSPVSTDARAIARRNDWDL